MTACDRIQDLIQERLDGPVDAERLGEVNEHLATCAECREIHDGLERVRAELQALPEVPFPGDALDAVWARTIRAKKRSRTLAAWSSVAAAAAIAGIAIFLRFQSAGPATPTPDELARAGRDARLALSVAARAIRVTEDTTVHRVLGGEVSPLIRRIPVRWPKAGEPGPIRSHT